MTQAQTAALIKALAQMGVFPQVKGANGTKRTKADMLAAKDRAIKATFTKRGIKDVVLMDRNDPAKDFNVRPYGRQNEDGSFSGWLGQGRKVKKGEKSVRGLFHISQTEEV